MKILVIKKPYLSEIVFQILQNSLGMIVKSTPIRVAKRQYGVELRRIISAR